MIIKVWYWPSHCSPSCHVSWDTCDPVLTNIKIVQWNWAEWHCLTGDMGTDHCWPRYVTSPPGHNAHESTIDTEILVFACKTWQMIIHLTSLLYNCVEFTQARVTFYASLAFNATLAFSVVAAPSVLVGGYLCVSDVSPVSQVSHVQVSCSSVHSTQLSCYTSTTLITSLTPVHQHSSD